MARVTMVNRAQPAAAGQPSDDLESTGFFLIGIEDGVIQEVSIEESVAGGWDFGGEALPYRQTSTVHGIRLGGASAAPRER